MPERGVRREFTQRRRESGGRFPVAELVRMADQFRVSFEAMTRRLEELGLIPAATIDTLRKRAFKPDSARAALALEPERPLPLPERFPMRYVMLAFRAFEEERMSEGELARRLLTDRVTARRLYLEERAARLDDAQPLDLDVGEDVLRPR
jgi:Zn-dependent peptidase ImmA (M78 family)